MRASFIYGWILRALILCRLYTNKHSCWVHLYYSLVIPRQQCTPPLCLLVLTFCSQLFRDNLSLGVADRYAFNPTKLIPNLHVTDHPYTEQLLWPRLKSHESPWYQSMYWPPLVSGALWASHVHILALIILIYLFIFYLSTYLFIFRSINLSLHLFFLAFPSIYGTIISSRNMVLEKRTWEPLWLLNDFFHSVLSFRQETQWKTELQRFLSDSSNILTSGLKPTHFVPTYFIGVSSWRQPGLHHPEGYS